MVTISQVQLENDRPTLRDDGVYGLLPLIAILDDAVVGDAGPCPDRADHLPRLVQGAERWVVVLQHGSCLSAPESQVLLLWYCLA